MAVMTPTLRGPSCGDSTAHASSRSRIQVPRITAPTTRLASHRMSTTERRPTLLVNSRIMGQAVSALDPFPERLFGRRLVGAVVVSIIAIRCRRLVFDTIQYDADEPRAIQARHRALNERERRS